MVDLDPTAVVADVYRRYAARVDHSKESILGSLTTERAVGNGHGADLPQGFTVRSERLKDRGTCPVRPHDPSVGGQ
jgi:hypothetical protein